MMLQRLKNHPILSKYIEDTCCENEVGVSFDEKLSRERYVIIKVDKYYNDLHEKVPPSVDCLIVRACEGGGYGLTIVELKAASSSANLREDNIKAKFDTTLLNFIKERFKDLLDIDYIDIKLYLVSNKEIHKRDLGAKLEALINNRWKFNGRNLMISPQMPTPVIKNCYGKNIETMS